MASRRQDTEPALPQPERVPGPVWHSVAEPHWFGVPASAFLLCLGFAGLGAGAGLIAAGRWPWGLVLLGIGTLLLLSSAEALRRKPGSELAERSAVLVADGRSRAFASAQVVRARLEELRVRHRVQAQIALVATQEAPLQRELGRAVWEGDTAAEGRARARLTDLQEQRSRAEHELAVYLESVGERIRLARLPVDQTVVAVQDPVPAQDPGQDEPG